MEETPAFDHSNEGHREVFHLFQFIIFFKVVLTTNL